MNKLIELLNEYHFSNTDCINYVLDEEESRIYLKEEFDRFYHEQRINNERIISKKFGFIKWLVDNDKINFDKCGICYEINSTEDHYNLGNRQDLWLIMLLSVSHTPVEDLVSYLR